MLDAVVIVVSVSFNKVDWNVGLWLRMITIRFLLRTRKWWWNESLGWKSRAGWEWWHGKWRMKGGWQDANGMQARHKEHRLMQSKTHKEQSRTKKIKNHWVLAENNHHRGGNNNLPMSGERAGVHTLRADGVMVGRWVDWVGWLIDRDQVWSFSQERERDKNPMDSQADKHTGKTGNTEGRNIWGHWETRTYCHICNRNTV